MWVMDTRLVARIPDAHPRPTSGLWIHNGSFTRFDLRAGYTQRACAARRS